MKPRNRVKEWREIIEDVLVDHALALYAIFAWLLGLSIVMGMHLWGHG